MVKRSDIAKVLKAHGLQNLRYSNGDVFRRNGKMVRAIPVASHSPMDATSYATDRARNRLDAIVEEFERNSDFSVVSRSQEHAVFKADNFEFELRIVEFPSYPASAGMDPNYAQSAVVINYLR